MKLLIINPNSSEKVTSNLKNIVVPPPETELEFYTAPSEAPPEIDGAATSAKSEEVVLPDLISTNAVENYDGFLVCCYLDHPLVHSIRKLTSKPVLGIMQATLLWGLANQRKLFVLTSVSAWEPLIDQGIKDFVGTDEFPIKRFEHTRALNVSVLDLSEPAEFKKISDKVTQFLDEFGSDINCVLLGCAGMAGLDEKLSTAFPGIEFVDSVKVGVEYLAAEVRFMAQQK